MNAELSEDTSETQEAQSLVGGVRVILRWVRSDFHWALLVAPMLLVVKVYFLSVNDIVGSSDEDVFKGYMEILHPGILCVFLIVSCPIRNGDWHIRPTWRKRWSRVFIDGGAVCAWRRAFGGLRLTWNFFRGVGVHIGIEYNGP